MSVNHRCSRAFASLCARYVPPNQLQGAGVAGVMLVCQHSSHLRSPWTSVHATSSYPPGRQPNRPGCAGLHAPFASRHRSPPPPPPCSAAAAISTASCTTTVTRNRNRSRRPQSRPQSRSQSRLPCTRISTPNPTRSSEKTLI